MKIASVLVRVEPKSKEAQAMVVKVRDILRRLKEGAGFTGRQQEWLISVEAVLREMEKGNKVEQ